MNQRIIWIYKLLGNENLRVFGRQSFCSVKAAFNAVAYVPCIVNEYDLGSVMLN
jgi:hypothetical protein